jgi:myo-inositol-1(or 4)-monophosphatase
MIFAMLKLLRDACIEVQKEVMALAGTSIGNTKVGLGAGGDVSRKIDIVAENTVINYIRNHGKNPTIIGEECGILEGDNNEGYLIMDALDGTTNATRDIPYYCCSLAYAQAPKLSAIKDAAVIDLPSGDLYSASKNHGAQLNGNKIHVKEYDKINFEDLVGGINISGLSADMFSTLLPYITGINHIRHYGANALELCYLARGFLDLFVDLRMKIRPTDMAASYLIVKESGGNILDLQGNSLDSGVYFSDRLSFISVCHLKIFEHFNHDKIQGDMNI